MSSIKTFKTVRELLTNKKTIKVPDYQRAYSWDEEQVNQFLYDVKEHTEKKTNYYVGHFLFEERNGDFYIIDGQQRLTTIVLLIYSIYNMYQFDLKYTRNFNFYRIFIHINRFYLIYNILFFYMNSRESNG